eukprot:1158599-Pelagomonas_calceolata.AAC.11
MELANPTYAQGHRPGAMAGCKTHPQPQHFDYSTRDGCSKHEHAPLDLEHEGEAKLLARGLHAPPALDLPKFGQGDVVGLEVLLLRELVLQSVSSSMLGAQKSPVAARCVHGS